MSPPRQAKPPCFTCPTPGLVFTGANPNRRPGDPYLTLGVYDRRQMFLVAIPIQDVHNTPLEPTSPADWPPTTRKCGTPAGPQQTRVPVTLAGGVYGSAG